MADQIQTASSGTLPSILSGQELYEMLMGSIEPDLTKEGLLKLEEKYRNEAPGEKTARKERYQKAVERFHQDLKKYEMQKSGEIRAHVRSVATGLEQKDRTNEATALQNLEQLLSAS